MNPLERRALAGLAGIFSLRMLGLFLILPVFALYADGLRGHTPFLVGLALGAYGLTQACLQIPLGMLSDRLGRKPVIIAGLIVFAAGSAVAALSDSISGVIIGRALQGAGAITAAVIAMIADLTREEQRTKAMAILGITIGGSFILSLLLGPVFYQVIGVPGIFWLTAGAAFAGIGVLLAVVPTPERTTFHRDAEAVPAQFIQVLRDVSLLRLDAGIFVLHTALMALFVVIPGALVQFAGMSAERHWTVYLPVMLLSVLFLFPAIILAEKKHKVRQVFAGAVLLMAGSQWVLFEGQYSIWGIATGLFLFFTAFNILEAILPSLVSKLAPVDKRGTALGVYSTFEFLGAFVGGAAGGLLHGLSGTSAVFVFSGILLLLWFVISLSMPEPENLSYRVVRVGIQRPEQVRALAKKLRTIRGVAEVAVIAEEGVAYLKVNDRIFDPGTLKKFVRTR